MKVIKFIQTFLKIYVIEKDAFENKYQSNIIVM